MNGAVTWPMLLGIVSMIVGTVTGCFFIWFILDGKMNKIREKASEETAENKEELANLKTHIAESYVTKAGMQEQTSQMLRAIESLGNRIDGQISGITDRLDRLYQPSSMRRSRGNQE